MKIREYEERFERPAPSWHQILMVNQKLKQAREHRRRWLIAAVLIAAMTITMEIASRRAAHSHAGSGSARERAFDVLPASFWRIFDRVRNSWAGGGLLLAPPQKRALTEADH
jgi:hypothetical protein